MTATAVNPTFAALLKEAVDKPGFISSAYRAFHNYSIGNQLAAAHQLAERGMNLSPIASFKAWGDKGRKIKKGAKALALCMPVPRKKEVQVNGQTEEHTFTLFVWKRNWFVLEDTEGEDFQHEVKTPKWDAALALACLDINEERFAMPDGNCQGYAYGRTIAINPVAILPHKTRFHELAHVVLGHTTERMEDGETTARDVREVEAEGTAYILTSILGLPGQEESRGYLQHWLGAADISEKSAQRIYRAADKILKAGAVVLPEGDEPTTHEPAAPVAEPAPAKAPAKARKQAAKAPKAKAKGEGSPAPVAAPMVKPTKVRRLMTDTAIMARAMNAPKGQMFIKPGEEVGKAMARMLSACKRRPAEPRSFPKYEPGKTTTADYVKAYWRLNFSEADYGAVDKFINLDGHGRIPTGYDERYELVEIEEAMA